MRRGAMLLCGLLWACGGSAPDAERGEPAPEPTTGSAPPAPSAAAEPAESDPAPEAGGSAPAAAAGTPAPTSASPMDGDIEWALVASATTISMAERADWSLSTVGTNRGTAPADLLAGYGSFRVNGQPSVALDMGFGNGLAPSSWAAVPPGGSADPTRIGLGESIFPAPGDYTIEMTRGAAVVSIVIHVTP